jgi:hypothetical protein
VDYFEIPAYHESDAFGKIRGNDRRERCHSHPDFVGIIGLPAVRQGIFCLRIRIAHYQEMGIEAI